MSKKPYILPEETTSLRGVAFGLGLMVLAAFQQFKMAPVLSEMSGLYGYSPIIAGGYMSIYAVAGLLLSRWFGINMHQGDGEKIISRILLLALIANLFGLIVPEQAYAMLVLRGLEGISACCLAIAGPVIVSRFMTEDQQRRAAAIIALWIPIGVVLAGLVSQIPASSLGENIYIWQLEWIISLNITLILWLSLKKYQQAGVCVLTQQRKPPLTETEKPQNSLWDSSQHRRANILTAITFLFWAGQNVALMSWLPSYLIEKLGYQQDQAALIFIMPIIFLGVFNLVAAPIMKFIEPAKLLFLMLIGQAIVAAILIQFTSAEDTAIQFMILMIYGAMAGITPSCLFRMPTIIFGKEAGTRAFGQMMMFRNLGVLAGPMIVAGAVQFTETKWASLSLTIFGASLCASAVCYLLIRTLDTIKRQA